METVEEQLKNCKCNLNNIEDCRCGINVVRNIMGDRRVTQKEWDKIKEITLKILISGHDEIKTIAEATVWELNQREFYMIPIWVDQERESANTVIS